MKKIRVFMTLFVSWSVLGVFGLLGPARTASADPPRQNDKLITAALAAADACSRGDGEKLRQLLDPAFQEVTATGQILNLEELIKSCSSGIHIALSNCQLTSPNIVSCDTVLSGGPIPPLPHPWTETSVLSFSNGMVIRLVEILSGQTAQDLKDLAASNPQPGMPATGIADMSMPFYSLLISLLLVAVGTLARRAYTPSD